MGNTPVVAKPTTNNRKGDSLSPEQLIAFVLPIYYTKIPLSPDHIEKLTAGWMKIRNNKAEGYLTLKKDRPEITPCNSSMEFFANRLMIRFYEIHPVCRAMFTKSSLKQGTMVMNSLTLLVKELENPESFTNHLKMIAISHAKLGVRATEFGIFGEALFWTLRLVLGAEDYDSATHTAWIQLYSKMLDVIVPIVLKQEIASMSAGKQEHSLHTGKRIMPIMDTTELVLSGVKDQTPLTTSTFTSSSPHNGENASTHTTSTTTA